ncbi:hypothetical protein F4781DRAFT_384557 [Annulohypoxylon bovei var. microspora]|nr:hypothetical protein F4781DRAFT_384557 [Annulohypoxylon bovei var. microspora]
MPIGDLLAEISGGNPSPAPIPKTPASSTLKRKAEDDSLSATSVKLVKSRQQDGSYSANKVTREVKGDTIDRSKNSISTSAKPSSLPHRTNSPATNGRYEPPVPTGPRVIGSSSNGRPTYASSSNAAQPKSYSFTANRPKLSAAAVLAASKAPLPKSSPTTPTSSDPSKPPKKGSYQEIMERAKKAQAKIVPGKVGVIQHRPIEKGRPVKPEPKSSMAKKANGKSYAGSSRPMAGSTREGAKPGMAARDTGRNGSMKEARGVTSTKARLGSLGGEAEKKPKKSATATTGYTGTARPRISAASGKLNASRKDPSSYKTGGLLAPPRSSRRDKYEDEYDDDLDDFIEYDEEDEPNPQGYGYDSEGSSDMEAGLSDIDVEERRAEILAREEDKREQALEEKLKREKEERRRRFGGGR